METVVDLKDVRKVYRMGDERIIALDDISLNFEKGLIYCLLGTSGSGKSTLLNVIAGLERPTKGQIRFRNINISEMTEKQLALFRQKHIGFVFQSYNLLPTLTALENVMLPLIFRRLPRAARKKKALEMLNSVGLSNRYKHKPSQLSGGQQQRVSIARAFVNSPEIVFCDEPTGNLDTKTTVEMMDLITGMAKKYNQTLIIVTHNEELVSYSDKLIKIRDGKVEEIRDIIKESPAIQAQPEEIEITAVAGLTQPAEGNSGAESGAVDEESIILNTEGY